MINLNNKYVPNADGKLRDLFIAECEKQGVKPNSERTLDGGYHFLAACLGGVHGLCAIDVASPCLTPLTLADFEQKKTVFDAVNYFKGAVSRSSFKYLTEDATGNWLWRENLHGNPLVICTIEEFNQCVDDLAKYGNKCAPHSVAAYSYEQYKKDAQPTKPLMVIEYVKITHPNQLWDFPDDLFFKKDSGEFIWTENHTFRNVLDHFKKENLYRKAEREVKEEKRWLVYESGVLMSEYKREGFAYADSAQVIEITVEV